MESSFNHLANDDRGAAVSLKAVRGNALQRLAGVQQSLEGKGVDTASIRAAKADPVGDMGILGSLIMGVIMGGPLSSLLHSNFSVLAAFNHEAALSGLDGIAVLRDQAVEGYRSRKLSAYPEGRRRCALEAARVGKKFNLVSANQNNRFSYDVQADMACMYEIIDMLDRLEDAGVTTICLDQRKPAYEALQQATGQKWKNSVHR